MSPTAGPDTAPTYVQLAWQRLVRQPVAVAALWIVAALLAVGIGAPLLACNQPLYWRDASGISFPLVRGLFNRLLFESAVDLLFNLLLVLSPGWALLRWLPWARWGLARFQQGALRALPAAALLAFLAMTPRSFLGHDNPLFFSEAIRDYSAEARANPNTQALFALRPFGYRDTDPQENLKPPSAVHWLGTDTEGRDVFSRIVYGARTSLTIGIVAVSIYVSIGIALGATAGFFGGKLDLLISRLIEVMICIPSFFLILTIAALIEERSIFHVMLIIGATSWTSVARLVRAEFLKNRHLEYVQAAIALGIPRWRIMFRHILPNAISPVLVSATFGVASAILVESSLAFLGVGDASVASWGETLNAGRIQGKLWLALAPGAAIFVVVSVFNLLGEGLRDALDPKLDQ